ncbi:MAG: prephenate dehydrogenase/arogenate dehydrogenase family protein [SAR202 cluster bacterium]|nr:prephenate dehydrogenase/arogenate dehydrogenase family protein [SAR202 cluster bacterium]
MSAKGAVKVIGCGLIGTSIALRLKEEGFDVLLVDKNQEHEKLASDLLGGSAIGLENGQFRVILIATPIEHIFQTASSEFASNPKAIFIEVGGLKSELHLQVESISALSKNLISVHPMAGREKSGPTAARSDLFESRAWIISRNSGTSDEALELGYEFGRLMGASIYELPPIDHDEIMASISHLPQILSSALAANLQGENAKFLNLSGQGLRDVTRLADSDPALWAGLLAGNSNSVNIKLDEVINRLINLRGAIADKNIGALESFFRAGRDGRKLIPGKHGAVARDYTYLPIVIEDKAGELARIINECAKISVNIEDLTIEHSPGQQSGLITLALSESDAVKLQKHLIAKGWLAHAPRK